MLQSTAKGAAVTKKEEARPATQAFVTEPLTPHTIAVGDVAHKNPRRVHDATLVGLAPPPPVHLPSLNTPPLALGLPAQQSFVTAPDERRLATILVVGTLLAMFAIVFSAVPESESSTPVLERPRSARVEATPAPAPAAVKDSPSAAIVSPVPSEQAVEPSASAAAPSQAAAPQVEAAVTAQPKVTKRTALRSPAPRVKASTKADSKVGVRRRP